MAPASQETAGAGAAVEALRREGVVNGDGVHAPGPDPAEGVRRAGGAQVAMATALDHKAQVMGAGEADGRRDIRGALGGDDIGRWGRPPGVQPAGVLRQARLVAM